MYLPLNPMLIEVLCNANLTIRMDIRSKLRQSIFDDCFNITGVLLSFQTIISTCTLPSTYLLAMLLLIGVPFNYSQGSERFWVGLGSTDLLE